MGENCFLNFLHLNELAELHLNQNLIKAIPLMITNERKIVMVNLQLLDLTGNPISEDTKLLPVASCPKLRTIIICRTGLARKHNGYPPLTKKYLINRLGIQVIKDMAATKTKGSTSFAIRARLTRQFHKSSVQPLTNVSDIIASKLHSNRVMERLSTVPLLTRRVKWRNGKQCRIRRFSSLKIWITTTSLTTKTRNCVTIWATILWLMKQKQINQTQ